MYKLRTISYHNDGEHVKGITIPGDVALFFEKTYFNITKSGASIVLTSGINDSITAQQVEAFDLETLRI